MDYLDPKKKKTKKTHLMIMYALLGIAIAIATVVTVYLVNGYSIDRETGQVIQNALLYVDTKPESADVYLNGEKQRGRTDARLVIAEGTYNVELKREGYKTWSRELVLEGGSLRRLTYARLIPEQLDTEIGLTLPSMPTMVTQSIDKRWLVLAFKENPLKMSVIDLERPELQITEIGLPTDLLITKDAGTWLTDDWADNNETFLAKYKTSKTTEYVLINRSKPELSRNLKTVFKDTSFDTAVLRNRKSDQVFLHSIKSGVVNKGNVRSAEVELAQEAVIEYAAFGDDAMIFVTANESVKDLVDAKLRKGDKTYLLRTLKKSDNYLLDISKIGNAYVMGVSSPVEDRVIVYNDPIAALEQNDFSDIPVPTTVLQVKNPTGMSISADSSVITARGGQSFASHEFEADRSYKFEIEQKLDEKHEIHWIDGQHMLVKPAGEVGMLMVDFDGSNQYMLTNSTAILSGLFSNNLDFMFTFTTSNDKNKTPQMIRTFMRSAEDR